MVFIYEFPSGYKVDYCDKDITDGEWTLAPLGKELNFQDFEISSVCDILGFLRKRDFSHELCMRYYDESILHISLDYLKPLNHEMYLEHLREIGSGSVIRRETEITKKLFPFIDFKRIPTQGSFFGFIPKNYPNLVNIEEEENFEEKKPSEIEHLSELLAEDTFIREYSPQFLEDYWIMEDSEWVDFHYGCQNHFKVAWEELAPP